MIQRQQTLWLFLATIAALLSFMFPFVTGKGIEKAIEVDKTIKETCLEIAKRYDIHFLEIGTDKDHVHFLIQSIPMMLPKTIVQTIKSITARQVFKNNPEVKKKLWGGAFWTSGYFINTVSRLGSETTITKYVKNQGVEKDYTVLHKDSPTLFDHIL